MQQNMQRLQINMTERGAESYTYSYLIGRSGMLRDFYDKATRLHAEIMSLVPQTDRATTPYFSGQVFTDVINTFDSVDAFLSTHLDNVSISMSSPHLHSTARISTPERNQTVLIPNFSSASHPHIKLPPIDLPKFNGDLQAWPAFINLFDSSIHSNLQLQPAQKLQYLVSCLAGEAKGLVSSLKLIHDNYLVARTLLKSRYENQRVLLGTLLNRLTSLDKVHADNLEELKKFRTNYSIVLESLKSMQIPIDNWDPLLIHMLVQQFDKPLRKDWEEKLSDKTDFPKLSILNSFIDNRIHMCEVIYADSAKVVKVESPKTSKPHGDIKHRTTVHHGMVEDFNARRGSLTSVCPSCKQNHWLNRCPKFLASNPSQRYEQARTLKLCLNCLSDKHRVADCTSTFTCRSCRKKHHTLLHFPQGQQSAVGSGNSNAEKLTGTKPKTAGAQEYSGKKVNSHHGVASGNSVLLATASVSVVDAHGQLLVCRALIDQCSEASFISESLMQTTRLRRMWSSVIVSGVGDPDGTRVSGKASLVVRSPNGDSLEISAFILPRVTSYVPSNISFNAYPQLDTLSLADPNPASMDQIDLLIGADHYASIIREGVIHLSDKLVAQNTIFGWIVSGSTDDAVPRNVIRVHHSTTDELDNRLRAFWELEEVTKHRSLTEEEQRCEDYFNSTTTRDSSGRFIVRLPFKIGRNRNELGKSEHIAHASLNSLLRKMDANEKLCDAYTEFLDEYKSLGHMTEVPGTAEASKRVFLPHHGVLREDKTTTKLRVVFNASCPTGSGLSLNDVLSIGPKLQVDITGVLLKWRTYRFVFSADIEKMFRQILVHPQDRLLQNILWRGPKSDTTVRYQLDTVTYGTGPAPYLAMRVVRELANLTKETSPLAYPVLTENTYVDDVMFGADTREELLQIKSQVVSTLSSGCMVLRKWASNDPTLLMDSESNPTLLEDGNALVKLLGVNWAPNDDSLVLKTIPLSPQANTKRLILSEISSLFDPLGFLSPIVIRAKCFMQSLWKVKLGWDNIIPAALQEEWVSIAQDITSLPEIKIDRWLHHSTEVKAAELVGFCDASEKAYAAVVYLRIVDSEDYCHINLVMAKSKVAPLKTLSIPRLELCGALLLKDLLLHVQSLIGIKIDNIRCYSDSEIVLAWLRKNPSTWATFVGNRVSSIQSELPVAIWRHVRSSDNPADLNSRGLSSTEFLVNNLWWQGAAWLGELNLIEEITGEALETDEERRRINVHVVSVNDSPVLEIINHYSSWSEIVRMVAYLVRFGCLTRKRITNGDFNSFSSYEIDEAKRQIFLAVQQIAFRREKEALLLGLPVNPKSPLAKLDPFIDEFGLIRIGGRLSRSVLKSAAKYPIVLSNDGLSTKLIRYHHLLALHGGLTLTLNVLRDQFWIIKARSRAKFVIHKCVLCKRTNPILSSQIMSDLPAERCTPSRPFTNTGIDYAGPFRYRSAKGRGHITQKSWIVIFVCLATKAIHLELVTDCTSKAFLATLDRFVARRGLPAIIFSDNGTTFQGADNELRVTFNSLIRSTAVTSKHAVQGLVWRFIPPGAPHFGGLWEAGVKSVKFHLTKLLNEFAPTYEELYTILCGIEACLNSRPLTPLYDDLDSLDALTPGHFLTGTSLLAVPKPVDPSEKICISDRWKQVVFRTSKFWEKWQKEYLHTLQVRNKWLRPEIDIAVNDLVMIKTPDTPPLVWPLARVVEVYPGKDKRVRVARVRTTSGEYVRPVTQLCVIPLSVDD